MVDRNKGCISLEDPLTEYFHEPLSFSFDSSMLSYLVFCTSPRITSESCFIMHIVIFLSFFFFFVSQITKRIKFRLEKL